MENNRGVTHKCFENTSNSQADGLISAQSLIPFCRARWFISLAAAAGRSAAGRATVGRAVAVTVTTVASATAVVAARR